MVLGFNDWDRFYKFFHFISIETTKNDDLIMKYSLLTHFFMNFPFWGPSGDSINFEFFKKLTIFKPLWRRVHLI